MNPTEYLLFVTDLCGPDAKKTAICRILGISRPLHDKRLENGVPAKDIPGLQRSAVNAVMELRRRARRLDRFTTNVHYPALLLPAPK